VLSAHARIRVVASRVESQRPVKRPSTIGRGRDRHTDGSPSQPAARPAARAVSSNANRNGNWNPQIKRPRRNGVAWTYRTSSKYVNEKWYLCFFLFYWCFSTLCIFSEQCRIFVSCESYSQEVMRCNLTWLRCICIDSYCTKMHVHRFCVCVVYDRLWSEKHLERKQHFQFLTRPHSVIWKPGVPEVCGDQLSRHGSTESEYWKAKRIWAPH